jgi:hypothetical protein
MEPASRVKDNFNKYKIRADSCQNHPGARAGEVLEPSQDPEKLPVKIPGEPVIRASL